MEQQILPLYRVFQAVAKAGSISKAADELYISQPAISKAIRRLEAHLQTTLFLRTSRGVRLTPDGEILFRRVNEAFSSLEAVQDELIQGNRPDGGRLMLGASTILCRYLLLPCLKEYRRVYPNVQLSITCQSSAKTLELLGENQIDVGLISRPPDTPLLSFSPLCTIEDIFVASPAYLEQNGSRPERPTILLLNRENYTRQYVEERLVHPSLSAADILEVTSMDLLVEFAKIGLGIAGVIREAVRKELKQHTLCEVETEPPLPPREVGFSSSRNGEKRAVVQEFVRFCLEYHAQKS